MSLAGIRIRIAEAAARAGRDEGSVRLVAVSKQQTDSRIEAVLDEGQRLFGENRVQEAAGRWPGYRERYEGISLHLIGPLQTNKARQAMEIAEVIESLDRPKLAGTLARLAQEMGSCPELFVQVNTGEEPQKAGILPGEAEGFVRDCREMDLPVRGLMCIPPAEEDPRPHFAMLRSMGETLGLEELSMGMSGDFEIAIEEGATLVRVGSAIFGERTPR
ncbi:YggS family pyridoxal phosphate-dependent enzyme [Pseudoroseicyclus sp. CXY001]|uniref:YggS family pyridoxal phosphate-dependent enzyme n=1 Tax=Pseudoroseicyclus sp. CXY001 TaxID=3242492 RepID=UPI003571423E